ncbi:hypothetical protein [Streptomyces sp. NRRL S-337]|uniref:hypothetical protein n=1 Tax=Streptomyces sp. NRRL S-337 TaxID=1463900 RepID=UPI00131B6900|nr:hypothetical protein [Streptomyces sp. NRRL S-337]
MGGVLDVGSHAFNAIVETSVETFLRYQQAQGGKPSNGGDAGRLVRTSRSPSRPLTVGGRGFGIREIEVFVMTALLQIGLIGGFTAPTDQLTKV